MKSFRLLNEFQRYGDDSDFFCPHADGKSTKNCDSNLQTFIMKLDVWNKYTSENNQAES